MPATLLGFDVVLHPGRLALEVAEVIELGAADTGRAHHFDLLDRRRVQWKNALDTLAERDFPHRERGARSAAVHPDDDAFEDLNPFLVAFPDSHVNPHRIARPDGRPLGHLGLFDQLNRAHVATPSGSLLLLRPMPHPPTDPAADPASGSAPRVSASGGFRRDCPTAAPPAPPTPARSTPRPAA